MSLFLSEIFLKLEDNKKFPYYQAERRIDIFINFFLNDIVRQNTKFKNATFLAPEFPLVKSNISAHAAHIDYLMYDEVLKTILLVELKTDNKSYDQSQVLFYLKQKSFSKCLEQVENLKMTGFSPKKEHLLNSINMVKENISNINVEVIVLKPSFDITKDLIKITKEQGSEKVHFIALQTCEVITKYQEEWNLFKKNILLKLMK
jgi:hypothetical protein